MRPAPVLHLHLHVHLHANASAPATRKIIGGVSYWNAMGRAEDRHYHDLVAQARATDDVHLKRTLLRIADRYHPRHLIDAQRVIERAFGDPDNISDTTALRRIRGVVAAARAGR